MMCWAKVTFITKKQQLILFDQHINIFIKWNPFGSLAFLFSTSLQRAKKGGRATLNDLVVPHKSALLLISIGTYLEMKPLISLLASGADSPPSVNQAPPLIHLVLQEKKGAHQA